MRADFEQLTRRELQVAALVADGLSDRDVAEKLSITRRTAGWHIEQILAKLDLKSRSQIAARVSQAEMLGFPLLTADPLRHDLPTPVAFIGWNPEVSQRYESLTTTRWLVWPGQTETHRQERLISLADAGYNPVIVRLTYAGALEKVAKLYPKTQFAIMDDWSVSAHNKNVTSLIFADHHGSYLVGAIAAQVSKTGTIGFVGGVHIPLIERFQAGYVAGARMVKPQIKVLLAYLTHPPDYSGFGAATKARVAADRMYANGADVVYHAAGHSGSGVFQAATSAGAFAIGVDSDEYLTAPADTKGSILTSMLKRVDVAVNDYVNAYARKAPLSGVMTFDLANGGVGYSRSNPLVQPYVVATDDLREQIVAGKICVPDKP